MIVLLHFSQLKSSLIPRRVDNNRILNAFLKQKTIITLHLVEVRTGLCMWALVHHHGFSREIKVSSTFSSHYQVSVSFALKVQCVGVGVPRKAAGFFFWQSIFPGLKLCACVQNQSGSDDVRSLLRNYSQLQAVVYMWRPILHATKITCDSNILLSFTGIPLQRPGFVLKLCKISELWKWHHLCNLLVI